MIRVIYFCPSEGMYGDNIALMRIMPYLVEKGVIPFFVVSFEGPFVDYFLVNPLGLPMPLLLFPPQFLN